MSLGLTKIDLLTNNPAKVTGLQASGIVVENVVGLEVGHSPHNYDYLVTKKEQMGHLLPTVGEPAEVTENKENAL